MTKFIVVEDGGIWAEIRHYCDSVEQAQEYIARNREEERKTEWFIYERT